MTKNVHHSNCNHTATINKSRKINAMLNQNSQHPPASRHGVLTGQESAGGFRHLAKSPLAAQAHLLQANGRGVPGAVQTQGHHVDHLRPQQLQLDDGQAAGHQGRGGGDHVLPVVADLQRDEGWAGCRKAKDYR